MTYSDDFIVSSRQGLMDLIDKIGFVPFFENEIEGFSLEEHIARECWYDGQDPWPAWEWKGPVIRELGCAYGKFLRGKAMYVSAKWFPDFANFRRDGYDFDARYDDGLASYHDKELFEVLDANAPILSKELKRIGGYSGGKSTAKKGFDTSITRLQKQCYVIISDFGHSTDKFGNEYGWGIAEYSTPEKFFGKKFTDAVYKRTPEESYDRVVKHLKKILPHASEEAIQRILK
ncbi:MAG: hypothetical protein J6U66_11255 [Lachnospiraceae bacterium]|nr:hypothetical protein [Lachnospiraceae bacterium]